MYIKSIAFSPPTLSFFGKDFVDTMAAMYSTPVSCAGPCTFIYYAKSGVRSSRSRSTWLAWMDDTRATRSRSTFADEGDYFRLDPFVTGQYLPTHFLAVATITAATITAKQTARQPREGGVNMMDNTDNATALPNVCSWFLQLSDCSCRLQSTLLR